MTTDKAFKRVVRARMAKTGERYSAARRTILATATADERRPGVTHIADDAASPSGYQLRGGLHPETATLANVLANQGVVSGLTGQPLTEAAILGIGGGLGAGYILWEFRTLGEPILTLGFRNQWQYPWITGWTGKTLERLEIEPDDHETGGAKSARAGARCAAGRRSTGHRRGRPPVDRLLGPARRDVGPFRPHRGRLRPGRRWRVLVDDGRGAVPGRARCPGRRSWPDRSFKNRIFGLQDDAWARSRRTACGRRCGPDSRTRSPISVRRPTRSRFLRGGNGHG